MEKKKYLHRLHPAGARQAKCSFCDYVFHHGFGQFPEVRTECPVLLRAELDKTIKELEELSVEASEADQLQKQAEETRFQLEMEFQEKYNTDLLSVQEKVLSASDELKGFKEEARQIHEIWKERCLDEAIWSGDYQNRWLMSQQIIDGMKKTLKSIEEKATDDHIRQIATAAIKAVESKQTDDIRSIVKQYEIFCEQLEEISSKSEDLLRG